MRGFLPHLILAVLVVTGSGCATTVDMDSVNRRLDDNAARIADLEKAQQQQAKDTSAQEEEKLQSLREEVEALRKDFADSRWTVNELTEKVEAFNAYIQEIDQFVAQFRKRGGEIDKALEELTNRLEADVRGLADKLKSMLDDNSP